MSAPAPLTRAWVASRRADRGPFERELEALVAVSSPSGDVAAAEEVCAVVAACCRTRRRSRAALLDGRVRADLLATLSGSGSGRVLLLGHLDTVVAHADHRPLGPRGRPPGGLRGGGHEGWDRARARRDRALAQIPESFASLRCSPSSTRSGGPAALPHVRFAGYDACLCFEAAARPGDDEALVAKRKAAATLRVRAHGVAAHSGSSPDKGRNALLALGEVARLVPRAPTRRGPTG